MEEKEREKGSESNGGEGLDSDWIGGFRTQHFNSLKVPCCSKLTLAML